MAHFLRGKQAGIQGDLSAGIIPELFALDDLARYGINSKISALGYDPVQSLLAVGTSESQHGTGQVYVFGQKRVSVVFTLPRKASVISIQFCAEKLVVHDTKNEVLFFSLESKRLITSYTPPGAVTAVLTDPCLDWAFVGLQTGDVIVYDLDREKVAPLRIPSLWKERNPRARTAAVVSLALHPRDVGSLLIGYTEGAAIFSFKQSKATKFFDYEPPVGVAGRYTDPAGPRAAQRPRLTQASWHPQGTFVITGYEDSRIVIWDVMRDGRIISARKMSDPGLDMPPPRNAGFGASPRPTRNVFKLAWCAKQNPEDTGLLIAGAASGAITTSGLSFVELGLTPNYSTSSWQVLSQHFDTPKRERILPTPAEAEVIDFCLIPRVSPHYAGASDPIAVIALLASGEVITLSFPSGHPISPTNQLHLSLAFVHPFVNKVELALIERTRWLGMTEKRERGPPILVGGAEATHPLKRFESRNIVQMAHADGTIRVWDAGDGDEIENEDQLQVDVARAVGRLEDVQVATMSMAGATGELAVGLRSGEVLIFRWNRNQSSDIEPTVSGAPSDQLVDIRGRADPELKEGLLPFTMLYRGPMPVTVIKMSDVGFVAVGYENGGLAVIDLRGPAMIYHATLSELSQPSRRSSFRKSQSQAPQRPEWPTTLEFSVLSLEGDDYSSIILVAGTNLGRVVTFKLLPRSGGGYSVQFVGSTSLDGSIVAILPINADTGKGAYASQAAVANLRTGFKVNGVILAVSQSGVRMFRPASAKGAQKTWDDFFCDSAAVVEYEGRDHVLVGLFGDGCARAYSIPGLKEIGQANLQHTLDVKRFREAMITSSGNIIGWTGPSELAVLRIWGNLQPLPKSNDKLFNRDAVAPPRPTISNLQWISGTQYVAPADLDVLIGGPDRAPSRRMVEQGQRAGAAERPSASRGASSASAAAPEGEGYWAYMQRQLNERTEKLGLANDSMDQLQRTSEGWANDVSKFVGQQKKKAVMGVIGSKFGL